MHNLSQNLKHLLKEAKLSENELARRTGVPQQVINRILSGQNVNPKIATLAPLAHYFTVSISQLLGDEMTSSVVKLSTKHLGLRKIPLLEWNVIGTLPLKKLVSQSKKTVFTDIHSTHEIFAIKMPDNSMEPKFSQDTLLIFDSQKAVADNDFVLFHSYSDNQLLFRQVFIQKNLHAQKCFNPRCKDYNLTPIHPESQYLGVLIQSRTDHNLP